MLRGRRKIDYFKMSQAERRKGQFEGFAETERDVKVSALVNVIRNTADLLIISAVVSWKDYDDVGKTRVRPEIDHPFFVGFHSVIAKMAQQKRAETFPNVVDFIFDDDPPLSCCRSSAFPSICGRKLRTTNIIERCFVEVRRRTRPMVCFVNVKSVDRIIYSIFQRFNLEWKTRTLRVFTQAA